MPKILTIDEMRDIAKSRNGECLSEKYNPKERLNWKCCDGHTWFAFGVYVKQGNWCPNCSSSISEAKCRYIIEKLTNLNFPKKKVKYKNSTLELDGYNEKNGFAFEYNGEFHYLNSRQSRISKKNVLKILKRDAVRLNECKRKNIKIIVIPYIENKNNLNLFNFIKIKIKEIYDIDISDMYSKDFFDDFNGRPSKLKEAKDLALIKNGKCLSKVYFDSKSHLEWECSKGHRWETLLSVVKRGFWCPECSGKKSLNIQQMKDLALKNNGKCLSDSYINNSTDLLWECENGHQWYASPNTIKNGNWCASCSGVKKLSLEEMRLLADNKNGKCISNEYINSHTKLLWECSEGHRWETKPYIVKQGSWCPFCKNKKRKR